MGFFAHLEFALMCMDFLAWPVIALGFPLVVSIRTIEIGSEYHMRKLVIYWTLFSLLSLFEFAFSEIIQWIPIWSSIKLAFTFWLVFPRFHGACYVYDNFIRPWMVLSLRGAIGRLEDKYNMDKGLKACQKLTAAKKNHEEPYSSQRDIGVNESGEEHDAPALKQVQVATEISKPTSYAAVVTKGMLPQRLVSSLIPEKHVTSALPSPEESLPQQKWSCTLCRVESTSEANLNNHLRGRKHKDACESLKSSILGTKQEGITAAVPPQKESSPTHKWRCTLCQVNTSCEKNLHDHLRGRKHKDACESLKSSILGTKQEEITVVVPPQEESLPTHKWRCKLCRVETTCENNLLDHLRGSKHKAMRESLKLSKPNTKQVENEACPTRHWCFACDVELVGGASLMSHLHGKRHASNVVANGLS